MVRRGQRPLFYYKMMDIEFIIRAIEGKIAGTEIFIVEVKIIPGKIVIALDKPTGITIEECAQISRYLYQILDDTSILETHELEVGSPGMDQPLKVIKQYLRRIGRQVRVVTKTGSVHQGKLESASEAGFSIFESTTMREGKKKIRKDEVVNFLFNDIKETRLELNFNKQIK